MRKWVALALALPAAWLAFQMATLGQALTYAQSDPGLALQWRGEFGPALSNASEMAAVDAFTPGQLATATQLARRALLASPIDAKALRVLGIIADREHRDAQAKTLMTLAADRTQRDPVPHLWLFQRYVVAGDWKAAMYEADTLMRKPPRNYDVPSIVAATAENPAARPALVERMRYRPPWAQSLVAQLARRSPAAAFDLLLRLYQAGSPPTDGEVGVLMQQMMADGAVMNAYLAWTALLPTSAVERLGDVYDPEFEGLPGAPPFNWSLASSDNAGADLAMGPSGSGSALYVHYSAKQPTPLAQQILLLTPGRYRLTARMYLEESGRSDELSWTLSCYGGATLAQIGAPDDGLVWREPSAEVVVPASGCDAQRLVLTGEPGERLGQELRAWVGSVNLKRSAWG